MSAEASAGGGSRAPRGEGARRGAPVRALAGAVLLSFAVALVVFSVGGRFAVYEGVEKLLHPTGLADPVVAFAVLGVSVVLEGLSLRTGLQEAGRERRPGQSLASFIRQTIGEAAEADVIAAVTQAISATEGVRGVIHLRTLQLGPDDLLVTAKVEFDDLDYTTLARTVDAAEARIRAAAPIARLVFLEPDVRVAS